MIKSDIAEVFRDYFNNYLTVAKFAEHHELTIKQATALIELGRSIHEAPTGGAQIEAMELRDYAAQTIDTAIYKDAGTGNLSELNYLTLGLAGEAGEAANKIKKLYRDKGSNTPEHRHAIGLELGDVFWYLVRLCDALGVSPETVLSNNWDKLHKRKVAGTIGGSGDDR